MKKHYPGTDEKAFGSGGIIDCDTYLLARLGGGFRLLSETVLPVGFEDNCLLSGRPPAENCTVAAAVRVLLYWERTGSAAGPGPAAPARPQELYGRAERLAAGKYRYTDRRGLEFWRISRFTSEFFEAEGRPARCRAVYRWRFGRDIAPEIRAGRPLILNLAAGYYGNHSVTVAGYRLYERQGQIFPMLCLADGWQSGRRWLHLDAFRREFGAFGIGSVNLIEPLT